MSKEGRPKREVNLKRTSVVLTRPLIEKLDALQREFGTISRAETMRLLVYLKFKETMS